MKMATFPTNSSVLREWAPLTDLFNKLPTRLQNGIFNQEVKLTCVDVLPDFIALGTNLGVVYWYDRKKKDLQRLRCENIGSTITVVKVISTVDYMLACGNKDGNISIFQIPKSHPDNLPESLKPKSKQVERYTVADMHKGAISAIEWSKNEESYSIPSASTFAPLSSSIRELTNKIHTSAIISAIPPFGSPLPNSFNIHTDVTSIISAEEATESPVRRAVKPPTSEATSEMKLVGNELDRNKRMEILNEIAKEEFDDTILFRHRRRKKHNNMTNSVGSLSSNSSDEVDSSISRPTLMNLSTVSGLPDPRSPDTILSDIEQKEKMLADILNFDQVKINLDDLRECENEVESKIDEIEIRQQQNVSVTQNSSGDLSDSTEDDDQLTHSPPQPKHFDVAVAPAVINIPNEWNLSQVKLSTAKDKSESDNSLGDWEIV